MDFLTSNIKPMYFKYLAAAFGSACCRQTSMEYYIQLMTALDENIPNLFVRIFMTPTEEILAITPNIVHSYGISFLLLPFNIFSTYYFQALMKPTASFLVSVGRVAVIIEYTPSTAIK